MTFRTIPRALFTPLVLVFFASAGFAQSGDTRPRVLGPTIESSEVSSAAESLAVVSSNSAPATKPAVKPLINLGPTTKLSDAPFLKFEPLILAAIDQRLGAPYSWGATGPRSFDCSGFVWSIFQSAGINFERESARS